MTIKFPQYSYEIKIIVTDDIEKAYYKVYNEQCPYKNSEMDGLHDSDGAGTSHMFLKPHVDAGIIAHESYHAVMSLFRWIGVEKYDEELIAYHLQYIISKIKLP